MANRIAFMNKFASAWWMDSIGKENPNSGLLSVPFHLSHKIKYETLHITTFQRQTWHAHDTTRHSPKTYKFNLIAACTYSVHTYDNLLFCLSLSLSLSLPTSLHKHMDILRQSVRSFSMYACVCVRMCDGSSCSIFGRIRAAKRKCPRALFCWCKNMSCVYTIRQQICICVHEYVINISTTHTRVPFI